MTHLSTVQIARAIGCCTRTIERAMRSGRLRPDCVTPGGHARFNAERLPEFQTALGWGVPTPAPIAKPDVSVLPEATAEDYAFIQNRLARRRLRQT